jgi:ABC-type glycerol-3-phosphate transport system substrate-binding protein
VSDNTSGSVSRRRFLQVGGLAAVSAATLAACSSASSGSSASGKGAGGGSISVWTWYGNQGMPNNSPLGPAFEKANPDIKVNIRTFGNTNDYSPALAAAIAAGSTPDIFAPSFSAISYGQQGVALDVRNALGASFLSQFFQSDNDQFTSNGKQYGLGWNAQSFGLFYSPAVLGKLDLQPPETWADLIAMAPKIKAAGLVPLSLSASPSYGLSDFVAPLVTQASDDPTLLLKIDAQEDGKTWNDDAVVAALDQFQSLVKGGVFGAGLLAVTYATGEQLLSAGKTAFLWDGSWVPADLEASSPNFQYAIAQNPAWEPGAKHWTGDQAGAALSLSATSPHMQEALDFIRFIYQPARYSATLNAAQAMPATKAAAATVSNPQVKTMTSWLLDGLGAPHILYGAGSEAGLSAACVAIVQGKSNPKEAAASIQAAVNEASKR